MSAQALRAQTALGNHMPNIQTCAFAAMCSGKQHKTKFLQGQSFLASLAETSLLCIRSAFNFSLDSVQGCTPGLSARHRVAQPSMKQ